LKDGQTGSMFPENCAVGILNSDYSLDLSHSKKLDTDADFDFKKASAFCGECKPGYKPTRNTFMNMVTACTKIDNCKTNGKGFSECEECETGFYFKYSIVGNKGGIDRTVCFKSATNHDENCYVFDDTNTKCYSCKNGFSKNHDGVCEQLKTSFCASTFNI
jgi:hypothetical protein